MPPASSHTAQSEASHSYRPDIDGLRAVAVLAVVLFHAFPDRLPGGFVGVDIFFVISGYLISGIILEQLASHRFSYLDFYSRRIKRIFPALILVLAVCYVIGWNVLFQLEYKLLNKHILGGAGFIANLVFWSESGYFDVEAHRKPLLHLWSLGIEEQFYFIWPILLVLSSKWRRLLPLTLALLAGSFLANLLTLPRDPAAAFFLPQTRFWQLLAGAVLACLARGGPRTVAAAMQAHADLLSWAGAALLALAMLLITSERAFPGWWALLPTAGAALLIAGGADAWVNRRVLSRRVLVWLGLISFPLYLWHWPLLSLAHVLHAGVPPAAVRCMLVLMSVLLAWLTYRFVEAPIRHSKANPVVPAALLALMGLMLVVSFVSFQRERHLGLPRAFAALNPLSMSGSDGGDGGQSTEGCGIADQKVRSLFGSCAHDPREQPVLALVGDSKAEALYAGLVRTSHPHARWLFIGGNGRGGPLLPLISGDPRYLRFSGLARLAAQQIARNPKIETVVVVAATRALFQLKNEYSIDDLPGSPNGAAAQAGLSEFVSVLTSAGKRVVLVVDNPTFPDPTTCMQRVTTWPILNSLLADAPSPMCSITLQRHRQLSSPYRELLDAVQRANPRQVSVFDGLGELCDELSGTCSQQKNGRLLYGYTDHLSDYGAGLVGAALNAELARATPTRDAAPETAP